MLWSEFVSCLDSLRTKIRSERNLKTHVDFNNDEIIKSVYDLLSGDDITKEPPIPASEQQDPLLAIAPEDKPEPRVVEVVERGDGQGRMIVMGRDKPFVPRKPLLEEVFDEKDLGK